MKYDIRYKLDVDAELVSNKIVHNPNYGGKACSVPGTCLIPVRERAMKPKFYIALEEHVSKNGFRNPILLYNTPEGLLLYFGGSRLRVAKRLGITVPAIIVDYVGDYALCPEVTPDNWQRFFTDVPQCFDFFDGGIDTHYSLERMRRDSYDPAGFAWTSEDAEFIKEEFSWLNSQ